MITSAAAASASASVRASTRSAARRQGCAAYSTEAAPLASATPKIPAALRGPSLRAALLLSRPPRLLRQPTNFESAYFEYNSHLRAYLAQPFTPDFYFKKGSAAEGRFEAAERERVAARAKTGMAKVGAAPKKGGDQPALVQSAAEAELYATLPRTTKADETNDVTSLERKLDRTLYLFVRSTESDRKSEGWRLPDNVVSRKPGKYGESNEHLHEAAANAVTSQLGRQMDIWVVSNLPIAVSPRPSHEPAPSVKTYTVAAHILSGSPTTEAAKESKLEYVWLTKEEAEQRIRADQDGDRKWNNVEALLGE